MTGRAVHDAANWVLAILTALVWCATYALFVLADRESRRRMDLFFWRWRQRLRVGRRGPRPVPARLLRPHAPAAPRRQPVALPALSASRTATARAVAVAAPARIAEWRADNLPLRYRLLGRVRRGVNDN